MRRIPCSSRPSRRTRFGCSIYPIKSTNFYQHFVEYSVSLKWSCLESPCLLPLHRRVARLVREPHHLEQVEHCRIFILPLFTSTAKSEKALPLPDFVSSSSFANVAAHNRSKTVNIEIDIGGISANSLFSHCGALPAKMAHVARRKSPWLVGCPCR